MHGLDEIENLAAIGRINLNHQPGGSVEGNAGQLQAISQSLDKGPEPDPLYDALQNNTMPRMASRK